MKYPPRRINKISSWRINLQYKYGSYEICLIHSVSIEE